jgi:predicted amidohydrolase
MPVADRIAINLLIGSPPAPQGDARRRWLIEQIKAAPDADLLVLPYMGQYPPFWRVIDREAGFAHGERAPFASLATIATAVKDRGIRALATAFAVVAEGVFYAVAVLIEPDGDAVAIYRQEHAINEPGWHERLYFQPGDNDGLPLLDINGLSIGLLLGGDLWVPEAARRLRLGGAQALLSVSGAPEGLLSSVRSMAQARAIENGVPVVWTSGDVGGSKEPRGGATERAGHLPWHQIMLRPSEIQAALNSTDPLQMRRPRLYQSLVRTWEACSE